MKIAIISSLFALMVIRITKKIKMITVIKTLTIINERNYGNLKIINDNNNSRANKNDNRNDSRYETIVAHVLGNLLNMYLYI